MNMKQNAALEMFEYLKEHLIPLAKDKGDKVYESDTTVQIARPENKSVWDCEKEVKQLLSKIGAYSASVKNSMSYIDTQNLLPQMKTYLPWLAEADSQALKYSCRQLDNA